jgi:hypothetical protein
LQRDASGVFPVEVKIQLSIVRDFTSERHGCGDTDRAVIGGTGKIETIEVIEVNLQSNEKMSKGKSKEKGVGTIIRMTGALWSGEGETVMNY